MASNSSTRLMAWRHGRGSTASGGGNSSCAVPASAAASRPRRGTRPRASAAGRCSASAPPHAPSGLVYPRRLGAASPGGARPSVAAGPAPCRSQARRSRVIEAQHPVAHRLQPDPADLCRSRTGFSVVDRCQGEQPADFAGILREAGKLAQGGCIVIAAQQNRSGHGGPHHHRPSGESHSRVLRISPHQSYSAGLGIRCCPPAFGRTNPAQSHHRRIGVLILESIWIGPRGWNRRRLAWLVRHPCRSRRTDARDGRQASQRGAAS